ncbi:MAG: GntR family transcriptional regulator [Spirochaetales bacterium]|nr:GntR family transcriptional regulator [Spirochaetales bacterium]
MEFSKLTSPSLKDLFVREIENRILSGNLAIGDQLPPERELSSKMGVSRTVINSGLAELAGKGFVEVRPRSGVFVSDFKRKGSVETLMAILRYNGGVLKRKESRSLLEIRLAIENLAIELAAPRINPENLAHLAAILADFEGAETAADSSEQIFRFHHEICVISENTILPVIFYSFKELSILLWRRYFERHGKDALLINTRELYAHLASGDGEKALITFQSSLKKTIDGIVSIYDED